MSHSIGLRVYRAVIKEAGEKGKIVNPDSPSLNQSFKSFVDGLAATYSNSVLNGQKERSWYLQAVGNARKGNFQGLIHYGTYGFASKFHDGSSNAHIFDRLPSHVEVIPLYFEIWRPTTVDFGLIAFQSFGIRSCIALVLMSLKEQFENNNKGYALRFERVMPVGQHSLASAQVKNIRLIKKNMPSDLADQYMSRVTSKSIDVEYVYRARRNGNFGRLADLITNIETTEGDVLVHDGIEFNEAIADVRVGNKLVPVKVLGPDNDAGVIDLTAAISRGADGHPEFVSIRSAVGDVLNGLLSSLEGDNQ